MGRHRRYDSNVSPIRNLVVLDAPSNLGLRPPAPGTDPGCYKLAGALLADIVVAAFAQS
jgi:arginase